MNDLIIEIFEAVTPITTKIFTFRNMAIAIAVSFICALIPSKGIRKFGLTLMAIIAIFGFLYLLFGAIGLGAYIQDLKEAVGQ